MNKPRSELQRLRAELRRLRAEIREIRKNPPQVETREEITRAFRQAIAPTAEDREKYGL